MRIGSILSSIIFLSNKTRLSCKMQNRMLKLETVDGQPIKKDSVFMLKCKYWDYKMEYSTNDNLE